ncbi:MAG TPA: LptF/LptG family permease, partial [Bacteroidales bacterium]|nr:LptF/LptG family permease [Bacteroidales bacterium]
MDNDSGTSVFKTDACFDTAPASGYHLIAGLNSHNLQMLVFDPEKNMLQKISILYFDKNFSLVKRLDAQSAVWANDLWLFQDVLERDFFSDGTTKAKHLKIKKISINKTPDDFKASRKEGEEM